MSSETKDHPPPGCLPGFAGSTALHSDRGWLCLPCAIYTGDYHWVYLWEWPIRAMHWLAAARSSSWP